MNAASRDANQTTSAARANIGPDDAVRIVWILFRLAIVTFTAGGILIEHGFFNKLIAVSVIHIGQLVLLGIYFYDLTRSGLKKRFPLPGQQLTWFDFMLSAIVFVSALVQWWYPHLPLWRVIEAIITVLFLTETWRLQVAISRKVSRPGLLFPLSFLTLIILGTLLIKLPVATAHTYDVGTGVYTLTAPAITWLDAAFTMTSAVCVTGLTVCNTAEQFSPFGQIIIALFIQLGGLGIIIFGSILVILIGRRFSLADNINLSRMLNDMPLAHIRGFVLFIILTTVVIELIGAAAMYPLWQGDGIDLSVRQRIGLSMFHAISAFCNAGFDITGRSMVQYRYSLLTHAVILPLLVIGGLGFPVLENFFHIARSRLIKRFNQGSFKRGLVAGNSVDLSQSRLSLHSKVVLTTSACLFLYGLIVIAAGQLMPYCTDRQSVEPLDMSGIGYTIADAGFMSLTARTAGFNSMPMDQIQPAGRFCLVTLMFVGGSPGSTAGGVKTTVLALLILSVVATLRQRKETEAFGRSVEDSFVRKAATLGICYLTLIVLSTVLLLCTQPFGMESILFEVVSAASTTGLSLGITSDLTVFGKVVLILTMFFGRIGPLALIAAVTFRKGVRRPYTYPHESVVLG